MNAIGRWTVALMLVLSARAAEAQTTPSPPSLVLSLDEAIRRGVENAPRMAEARARETSAGATTDARRAAGLPSVTTSASYVRTNHVIPFGFGSVSGVQTVLFPDLPDNYRVRAEMDVPLYSAGRVQAALDAARSEEAAVRADRDATIQDVHLDVIRAYWALVTARENITVIEHGLERTDAYVQDVRSRVDAGVVPPNDLLSAQAQRARQNVHVIQARNTAAAAEIELARLIGVGAGQPIVTTTTVLTPMAGMADVDGKSVETLLARSQSRAERTSLNERRSAFEASAAAALASRKPWIGAIAAVEPSSPNQRFVPRTDAWKTSWDLGVNVTWPVFDGGKARADYAVAVAQADAVEARTAEFDGFVQADIRQRLLDLDSGRSALTASDEAVAAATEARRVVEERYRAGVATSTDVLDAQVALLEAELERTMLNASLRLSEARLLRALGGL